MFNLSSTDRYFLYAQSCDMRKGFNGLSGIVRNDMGMDPVNGDVYIFINKRKNQLKLLHWEYGGFVIYHKRLEEGVFVRPDREGNIYWRDLILMVDGVKVFKEKQVHRYQKTG